MNETQHGETCPKISKYLARLSDKWSVMVLVSLNQKRQRFSELKRSMAGISQRMLTLTLRNLERDGLVQRTVTPTIPPRVDYELTDLGRSICGQVQALGGRAIAWCKPLQGNDLGRIEASILPFFRHFSFLSHCHQTTYGRNRPALGGWVVANIETIDASRSAFDRDKAT